MSFARLSIRIGAPAAVMLAAVVNTAAANPAFAAADATPDLSWALKGGVTQASRGTRAYLAHKAASNIHSLDRMSCAAPEQLSISLALWLPARIAQHIEFGNQAERLSYTQVHSTYQHSAP